MKCLKKAQINSSGIGVYKKICYQRLAERLDSEEKMKANKELRNYCYEKGVNQWQVASAFGYSEASFTRIMRNELPEHIKDVFRKVVDELSKGNLSYTNSTMKSYLKEQKYENMMRAIESRAKFKKDNEIPKDQKIGIYVDKPTKEKIMSYCAKERCSMNGFINRLIHEAFCNEHIEGKP